MIYIKFMVSNRCKMLVKAELKKLGFHFIVVDMGIFDIMENIDNVQREQLRAALLESGFELLDNKKAMLIEKIRNTVIEMVHYREELSIINFSEYLSEKLDHDYTYISNLFSEVQGITIEKFVISLKIERVKELIMYNELNLTEIAWMMHFSSVAQLSNQFKKVTGLTPSRLRQMKNKRRNPIEEIGAQEVSGVNNYNGKNKNT